MRFNSVNNEPFSLGRFATNHSTALRSHVFNCKQLQNRSILAMWAKYLPYIRIYQISGVIYTDRVEFHGLVCKPNSEINLILILSQHGHGTARENRYVFANQKSCIYHN